MTIMPLDVLNTLLTPTLRTSYISSWRYPPHVSLTKSMCTWTNSAHRHAATNMYDALFFYVLTSHYDQKTSPMEHVRILKSQRSPSTATLHVRPRRRFSDGWLTKINFFSTCHGCTCRRSTSYLLPPPPPPNTTCLCNGRSPLNPYLQVELNDWQQIVRSLQECPNHTIEVVPLTPTWFGAYDTSNNGMGGVLMVIYGNHQFLYHCSPYNMTARIIY